MWTLDTVSNSTCRLRLAVLRKYTLPVVYRRQLLPRTVSDLLQSCAACSVQLDSSSQFPKTGTDYFSYCVVLSRSYDEPMPLAMCGFVAFRAVSSILCTSTYRADSANSQQSEYGYVFGLIYSEPVYSTVFSWSFKTHFWQRRIDSFADLCGFRTHLARSVASMFIDFGRNADVRSVPYRCPYRHLCRCPTVVT